MANKDNIKPGTDERDEYNKPKGTGNVGQSGTMGSEGGGTGRGMGRPEDVSRDRDLEEEPGSLDRNRPNQGGTQGTANQGQRKQDTGSQGDRNR